MIVVAIMGLLVGIAVPNFVKTRTQAQKNICIENLTQIESAKQIWGLESAKKTGDPATEGDLIGPTLYIRLAPKCPGGGKYDYTSIGTPATCTEGGHEIQ
ncbi:MAG: prepilin-type cleavage/methylation domain-containing protein [Limisphaerales bacterium]